MHRTSRGQFERLDANHDGEVPWKEAYNVRVKQFVHLDKNLDGIVERNEFKGQIPFSMFDANAASKLQLSESIA